MNRDEFYHDQLESDLIYYKSVYFTRLLKSVFIIDNATTYNHDFKT